MKKDNELVLMAKNLLTENGYDGERLLEIINSDGNNYQFYEKEELYNELMKVKDKIQNVSAIVQDEDYIPTKDELRNFSKSIFDIKIDLSKVADNIHYYYSDVWNK